MRTDMDFVSVFSAGLHMKYNLSRHPEISISTTWASQKRLVQESSVSYHVSASGNLHIELGMFSKKTQSFFREIPTTIEVLKMELGGCMAVTRNDVMPDPKKKLQLVTGPCFFSKLMQIFEGQTPSDVFCAKLSTIMQLRTQLSFDTRCAYRKPLRKHVKFSNAWHGSWPKSSSGGMLKQFWLKSISRVKNWLSKSRAGSIFKMLLLKSSFFRLVRLHKRRSGSVLNLLPCKWSSHKLRRFRKTRGGTAPNWFLAMLRIWRLSKLSKLCSSRVVKLLLDRSRWCRCFNPFKAPGKNEVNLLPCR